MGSGGRQAQEEGHQVDAEIARERSGTSQRNSHSVHQRKNWHEGRQCHGRGDARLRKMEHQSIYRPLEQVDTRVLKGAALTCCRGKKTQIEISHANKNKTTNILRVLQQEKPRE